MQVLRLMNLHSNDEFCIQNDEICIENDNLRSRTRKRCSTHGAVTNVDFLLKWLDFVLKMFDFVFCKCWILQRFHSESSRRERFTLSLLPPCPTFALIYFMFTLSTLFCFHFAPSYMYSTSL